MSLQTAEERNFVLKLLKAKWLCELAKEAAFIATCLTPAYEQTSPASVGALTGAPLITDGIEVYGFMNYQIESFLEKLSDDGAVVFNKG